MPPFRRSTGSQQDPIFCGCNGSFTARLVFPATTMSRLQREAPLAAAATTASHQREQQQQQEEEAAAATATERQQAAALLPAEIADQLRKLFQGMSRRATGACGGWGSRVVAVRPFKLFV